MVDNKHYDASNIKVLEWLEPVRQRPGMYIGSTDVVWLHHMIQEIVDNAVDEALAWFCTHITTVLHADNSVTVYDNGRWIPVDKHPKTGKSALETVLQYYMLVENSTNLFIKYHEVYMVFEHLS